MIVQRKASSESRPSQMRGLGFVQSYVLAMLLERPFYLNLSLVAREGESSKWWAISGSKCLSCQMRHLCWSINSSNCFHMCFYIFKFFCKTSNFARNPTRMKMRRTKRLSSLCSIRAQASETLKDTVAQEEKMMVRYILYTTASVDLCTFMGFGSG